MLVAVPREVKESEHRVGLTPASVRELTGHRHQVLVQTGAGEGIGASDDDYRGAGAEIALDAAAVFAAGDMIVKVKEPQAPERAMLRPGQLLFTYLHLAPDAEQTRDLIASGAICIAYETVTSPDGGLPLLAPMSRVAGRLAVQAGAVAIEQRHGGAGILIGGIPGVPPAKVVIIGGGVVGENATQIAVGMGADVVVLDRSPVVLDRLSKRFGSTIITATATAAALERYVLDADLVIGAVLVTGARAPKLVSAATVAAMRKGSVLVDVAIDQGGCFETSHPTTHSDPTYIVDGVVHYCVANMPGVVPRTSTHGLNDVTLPFVLALAGRGTEALVADPHLRNGLNVCRGQVTEQAVAEAYGVPYVDPLTALANV